MYLGYGETAKMICESALCLALERSTLKNENFPTLKGGVVTASSAMGSNLVKRLRIAGMKFELV
jgi:short subunit dehydrogenase-like uncharacterized protein